MRAYHFLREDHALQALKDQRLKVATINELNDPFELLACDLRDKRVRRVFDAWRDRTAKSHAFLCFSRTWKNPLLWSHYADRHRGVALEFEIDRQVAIPVNYSKHRMYLNVAHIMANGGFTGDLAEKLATTKSEHWSYEDEVRVPVELAACDYDGGLYFERLSASVGITGLIAGPLSNLTVGLVQRHLPRGQRITIRWSRLAFRAYDVVRNRAKPHEIIEGAA